MTLSRAYYHCEHCGAGFCPRDGTLSLEGSYLSPHVLRMVGIVGARVSFEEGHDLLANWPASTFRPRRLSGRPNDLEARSSKTSVE